MGNNRKLKLKILEQYRDEILKAEIGALLFNLGKTHIGFWEEKEGIKYFQVDKNSFNNIYGFETFKDYKKYYSNSIFEIETKLYHLEDFFNRKIKFPFKVGNKEELNWTEFFKGNASEEDFIKKIFFRGCENINSGIDKGSPNKQLEPPLWLSNAFGSFKKKIEEKDLDKSRLCFFSNLARFLNKNNHFQNPNWMEIRDFILEEIRDWYSGLLSDSRFPVNDVSLFDQAYMTASMFKAVLSLLVMDEDLKGENIQEKDKYFNSPSPIKWRILGIQYDKLGLAEKGYKPAQIQWYRETAKKIDEELKKLLECEYPIGNEIYRDETGIYFIVGEDLGESDSNLAELKDELKEIKNKILEIFQKETNDEFYPAIFLTKASRGLMNLTYLLEEARNNFLQANGNKKNLISCLCKGDKVAVGICEVCKCRFVYKKATEIDEKIVPEGKPISDDTKRICEVCYRKKTQGGIEKWLKNRHFETIWTTELKDKNDRIALVTLKFELPDWITGNLLNSLLARKINFLDFKSLLKDLLLILKEKFSLKDLKDLNISANEESRIENFLKLFDKKGIQDPFNNIVQTLRNKGEIGQIKKEYQEVATNLIVSREIENFLFVKNRNNVSDLGKIEIVYNGNCVKLFEKKGNEYKIKNSKQIKKYLWEIYAINFIYLQIRGILLERSIGSNWETFICKQLNEPTKKKIDFKEKKIIWENLNDNDIDFLSIILLQFLLRKNPSPARLRRIWENTREFFEEIERNIKTIIDIPEDRCIRFYWDDSDLSDGEHWDKTRKYEFWKLKGKIFLITYDNSIIKKYQSGEKVEFKINDKVKNIEVTLSLNDAKMETYKPYMSIIDPTPVSWQFIIPAEYVPNLIDKVLERYNKNFKYVYGKLSLHIGIVIQDYNKPLYVGLNALRRIRRDVKNVDELWISEDAGKFCMKHKKKFFYATPEELCNKTEDYYSLYWENSNEEGYLFHIKPKEEWKKWISTLGKFSSTDKVQYIPNTFDFEFLDTNTRRNDIYYGSKGKRAKRLKANRPYELESSWEKFKIFKEIFSDKTSSSKLHKLISLLYSKLDDEEFDERHSYLLSSAFVNILELKKNKKLKDGVFRIFEVQNLNELTEKLKKRENVLLFLDMFEFWHTALKEV